MALKFVICFYHYNLKTNLLILLIFKKLILLVSFNQKLNIILKFLVLKLTLLNIFYLLNL